jgi:transposase
MCGVRTGIITAAIVTDAHDHDSQQLPDLLEMACQAFKIKEVLGDTAYASETNFEAVLAKGARPYFKFNKTATGAKPGAWRDIFQDYKNHRSDWEEHYRKRKIVESVFSAVKRMFGERLRSKGDVAARNELLLKLLCYNLCCLLRCMDELGIDVEFAREAPNGWLAEP